MSDRYIRFKVEAPANITKKKDLEVYRKLEYMGPVEDGKAKKMYFRLSIKKPWRRYMESNEYLMNRDDNPDEMFANVDEVEILEDMDKSTYIKKYFTQLFI